MRGVGVRACACVRHLDASHAVVFVNREEGVVARKHRATVGGHSPMSATKVGWTSSHLIIYVILGRLGFRADEVILGRSGSREDVILGRSGSREDVIPGGLGLTALRL